MKKMNSQTCAHIVLQMSLKMSQGENLSTANDKQV